MPHLSPGWIHILFSSASCDKLAVDRSTSFLHGNSPLPLLGFCALYTQTMRYAILNQLRVNMREKNIENLHPSQKPIIPIQVQHPGHPNVAQPTPSAMQNDTKWCKMMQNGAKWCKMIQIPAGGNSCCTQRRCHPRPPLTRPQPHHRHSLEWCAVLCSGESSETRKLLP